MPSCGASKAILVTLGLFSDKFDLQRQWWVQCENIIGHIDLYQYFCTNGLESPSILLHGITAMITPSAQM